MPPPAPTQGTETRDFIQRYDINQLATPTPPPLGPVQQDQIFAPPSSSWPTPNINSTAFPTPPLSQRPPGIPWEVPLPASDDSSDSDVSNDGYPLDARPLSYSDTETERKSKIRFIKKMKKQPPPPPPFIDDKDTDPKPLSYSDTENDRERKLNFQKKYPIRKKIKIPKYTF